MKTIRPRRFYLHYNKPFSKQLKRPVWSVHFHGTCYIVDMVDCEPPTQSKVNRRQPFVVMRGWAKDIELEVVKGRTLCTIKK